MKEDKLIFLDTETTGTGPMDRLCQVAYAYGDAEVDGLYKSPVPISIDAMAVTHITNKMVADCPPFAGSPMFRELEQILASGVILVAHNAMFDVDMLGREGLVVPRSIDTFKLSHFLDTNGVIPRHNLQYLRYYHDLEVGEVVAHDALGDVHVLRALFAFQWAQMLPLYEHSEERVLEEMLAVSARPILMKKFNFGKYTGQTVKEVADKDADYLAWLFNQKVMTREQGGEDDENWIYTLDYYLNAKK